MRVTSSALAGISFFLLIPNAGASFVLSLNLLDPNDLVSWSRLGDPGSGISTAFSTDSVAGVQVFGNFAQPRGGTVAEVCPAANCNYAAAPGFQTGDFLIWTEDADGNGTGPLTMVFSRPVQGAGVYLQVTAPSIFAAEITEIAASNTNSYSALSTTGDPLFLGVLDSAPDITGITVGGLSCAGTSPGLCAPTDFAIDSVYLVTNVPESGVPISVALGLGLLLGSVRKQVCQLLGRSL